MAEGQLDGVGVWEPFAGCVKVKQHAPIALQPVNLMSDDVPLEFTLGIGVRESDMVLKYALDHALEASAGRIGAILDDFGAPLVRCSECLVPGVLPSHGPYTAGADAHARYLRPLDRDLVHVDFAQTAPGQVTTISDAERSLAAGADPTAALMQAVRASDAARARLLATRGAGPDARDSMGATPLTTAIAARDSATVHVLPALGADANQRSSSFTRLTEAACRDHVPSVQSLLHHGASLTMTDRRGLTPLCMALDVRSFLAASALIKAGAAPSVACGKNRLAALMITATHERAEARGNVPVDGGQYLSDGVSPLDVGRLLVDRGADVNAAGSGGVTALMIAAGCDNGPLIAMLAQAGAKIDARADDGTSALDIARDNGNDTAENTLELMAQSAPHSGAAGAGVHVRQ